MRSIRSDDDEYGRLHSYIRQMRGSDSRTAKYLAEALKSELTEKQLRAVLMYYGRQMTMAEIAKALGINKSTVSRTIRRGREKLRRCLKYGARELLIGAIEDTK